MLLSLASVVAGLVLLVFSADRFVVGAAAIARHFGVPTLLVGLTLVGIGTSLPEMVVAIVAALQGKADLAIGNVVGSNIANISLVLGCAAVLAPVAVGQGLMRRELPLLVLVSVGILLMALDGQLSVLDGVLMLAGLAGVLFIIARAALRGEDDPVTAELEIPEGIGLKGAWISLLIGLVLLPVSSQMLVWGASNIAYALGVSELVVGLTIVAVGTSLPELATAIAAVAKREHDLVLGNVVGSNLFNLLAVLPVPALLAPGWVSRDLLLRDLPVMLGLTLALVALCALPARHVGRLAGAALLVVFVIYEGALYVTSVGQ
ncbi:MAG: calcium/sodium antiporter [Salinisphaeraceae bacterium]|nr:calcium/sodium antiporter [Salinisphaeraceae bacterium]